MERALLFWLCVFFVFQSIAIACAARHEQPVVPRQSNKLQLKSKLPVEKPKRATLVTVSETPPQRKNALIIVGPSASGKTTLVKRLLADLGPQQAKKLVRHTSRPPRPNEVNNTDYTFVLSQYIHKGVAAGEFIVVSELCENVYGISKRAMHECLRQPHSQIQGAVSADGKHNKKRKRIDTVSGNSSTISICVSDMIVSAMVLDALNLDPEMRSVVVFIRTPNITLLEQRLHRRNTETNDTATARIHRAKDDLNFCNRRRHLFDYCLNNIDLETTYRRLIEIVQAQFGPNIVLPLQLSHAASIPNAVTRTFSPNGDRARNHTFLTNNPHVTTITGGVDLARGSALRDFAQAKLRPSPVRQPQLLLQFPQDLDIKLKVINNVRLCDFDTYY